MKLGLILAFAAGTCGSVLANPQESVTFTNVASRNLMGAAGNEVRTATFTGAYSVQKVTITGTLTDPAGTGTWAPSHRSW
ncbi:MAG: hypothetical protein QM783_19680 [Phycisphaerales bacterium]